MALGAWYRDCLDLEADEHGLWRQEAGPTVFAAFESETDYLGSRDQQAMINFRVCDLDAMLVQLRAKGADVAQETQDMEGVGRLGRWTLSREVHTWHIRHTTPLPGPMKSLSASTGTDFDGTCNGYSVDRPKAAAGVCL